MDETRDVAVKGSPKPHHDEITIDLRLLIINLFIVFHLIAITFWNLPVTQLQQSINIFNAPYMALTGCWQTWGMFSPDPANINTYLTATIHYKDGSTRQYTYPRIQTLGIFQKYRQERWRKFIENTQSNDSKFYWPYLARYAAIVNNYAPKTNPVEWVRLYRNQCFIARPGNPHLAYYTMKMATEHVDTLPSPGPLMEGTGN